MDWGLIGTQAVLALIPVLTLALTALVSLGFAYLRKRMQWLEQTQVDEQVEASLKALVVEAQQTTVDGLKAASADGKLTPQEAAAIKAEVLRKLQAQITQQQMAVLHTLTNDVQAWLSAKLEKVLVEHKLDVAAAIPAPTLVVTPDPPSAPAPTTE